MFKFVLAVENIFFVEMLISQRNNPLKYCIHKNKKEMYMFFVEMYITSMMHN